MATSKAGFRVPIQQITPAPLHDEKFRNARDFFDRVRNECEPMPHAPFLHHMAGKVNTLMDGIQKQQIEILSQVAFEWYGAEFKGRICADTSHQGCIVYRDISSGAALVTFYNPETKVDIFNRMIASVRYRLGPPLNEETT